MKPSYVAVILVIVSFLIHVSMSFEIVEGRELSYVQGYIYEIDEGITYPVSFAKVSVYQDDVLVDKTVTNKSGLYSFSFKPGLYTIEVEKFKRIPQKAFVILESNVSLNFDFYLEVEVVPYEIAIIVEGLPEDIIPEIRVDGSFFGYVLNGTEFKFREGTFHVFEVDEIYKDDGKYIPVDSGIKFVAKGDTVEFRYKHQYYASSITNPWINNWYDEDSTIYLETRDIIYYGNSTRSLFNAWLKNGDVLKENPIRVKIDSSFNINSNYTRQYLITATSEKSIVEGGGWYDEGAIAKISIAETEIGAMPFKDRFKGWTGDLQSQNATVIMIVDEPKDLQAEWERVEPVEVEELDPMYKAIIAIGILIAAAKILSGVFAKLKLPEVLGELSAGMILGPYALGGLQIVNEPIIELNEYVLIFAEIGAILLLFIAGLEVSFGQFRTVGAKSAIVGIFGVIVPFFSGLYILQFFGFTWNVILLVAATLTATSIAITLRTLEDMGKLQTEEGSVMINSAVIDDVLGLVVLAVVMSIVTSGVAPKLFDILWLLFRTIIFWLLLLAVSLTVLPRIVGVAERWKARGTVEIVATTICFGSAVSALVIGLSPIVGAFAAGMALASSRVIARVRDYIDRLSMLFSPIFFAVIGAEFNIRALSFDGLWLILILLAIAVMSKLVGCGLPAALMLKDSKGGFRVGLGMISRGEVGLIIAGIGITSGIMSQDIYGAVVAMVILTTIASPIALRWVYTRDQRAS